MIAKAERITREEKWEQGMMGPWQRWKVPLAGQHVDLTK
jgi:hypothetical protein